MAMLFHNDPNGIGTTLKIRIRDEIQMAEIRPERAYYDIYPTDLCHPDQYVNA